jgi:hypothetical protein
MSKGKRVRQRGEGETEEKKKDDVREGEMNEQGRKKERKRG